MKCLLCSLLAGDPDAEAQRRLITLGRYGPVEDIAGMLACPAGPHARRITGAGFAVHGGLNA